MHKKSEEPLLKPFKQKEKRESQNDGEKPAKMHGKPETGSHLPASVLTTLEKFDDTPQLSVYAIKLL